MGLWFFIANRYLEWALNFRSDSHRASSSERGMSRFPALVLRSFVMVVAFSLVMALCRTWMTFFSKSISSHSRPIISPRRIPVWSAISRNVRARMSFTRSRSRALSSGVKAVFSSVCLPLGFSILLTGDLATSPFSIATVKMLRRWISTLD